MKVNSNLYRLIKSLSRTEKSYFKKFAKRHSRNSQRGFLKLFEVIDSKANGVYDEEDIKAGLKDEQFVSQLPVVKNYLYSNILKSLNLYYSENEVTLRLSSLINSAEILFQKGLMEQALKLLEKAKDIAYKSESDIKLVEIISSERKVLRTVSSLNEVSERLMNNYNEEIEVLERLKNLNKYKRLFDELVIFTTGKGVIRNREQDTVFKKIASNKILSDVKYAKSPYAQIFFHLINLVVNFVQGNSEDVISNSKKLINICDSVQGRKYIYGYEYTIALQQMALSYRHIGKYDKGNKYITILMNNSDELLRSYPLKVRNFLISRTLMMEISYNLRKGEFDKSMEILKRALSLLPEDSYRDEKEVTYYLAAINFYGIGQTEKALTYLNKIFNSKGLELRTDIQISSRMLNLILHYELGNTDGIYYFMKSTYRYLKKKDQLMKFESLALSFLKELSKTTNEEEFKYLLLKNKEKISKVISDPVERNAMGLLDLEAWIESKIEGKSFQEAIRDKYQNYVN